MDRPFGLAGINNKVGAPSLRSVQEPALACRKGRVPRTPAVTLSTRPDPEAVIFVRRSSTKVQLMHSARAMQAVGHDKPHDIGSIVPALHKTQGRGTHYVGNVCAIKSPGHPPTYKDGQ